MGQLFTKSYDEKDEEPVDESLFSLLTATGGGWVGIFAPPQFREQKNSFRGKERSVRIRDDPLIAVNHPEPSLDSYGAEIYDTSKNTDYFVDNKARVVYVREGFSCGGNFVMSSKLERRFRFRGTVDEIVEMFRSAGYTFQQYSRIFKPEK